jgi:hypothetical protein
MEFPRLICYPDHGTIPSLRYRDSAPKTLFGNLNANYSCEVIYSVILLSSWGRTRTLGVDSLSCEEKASTIPAGPS